MNILRISAVEMPIFYFGKPTHDLLSMFSGKALLLLFECFATVMRISNFCLDMLLIAVQWVRGCVGVVGGGILERCLPLTHLSSEFTLTHTKKRKFGKMNL